MVIFTMEALLFLIALLTSDTNKQNSSLKWTGPELLALSGTLSHVWKRVLLANVLSDVPFPPTKSMVFQPFNATKVPFAAFRVARNFAIASCASC